MSELELQDNDFTALRDPAAKLPRSLSIEDCDLVATAPPRQLDGVEQLDLIDCALDSTSLEQWLAACPDLKSLDIEGATLGDLTWSTFPYRLQQLYIRGGKLSSLRSPPKTCGINVLELTACGMTAIELPSSLPSCTRISLAFNDELLACPDLPWSATPFELDLRGCGLTDWPKVHGSNKVRKIDLSDNQLGGIPESIGEWHSLECLRLQDCAVATIDPAIASCKHLSELWLADNPLNELPAGVCELSRLQVLELKRCGLSFWPEPLCKLQELEALLLNENQIERVPESIVSLRNLRNLMLWKTGLRELPASLSQLKNLQQLEISYNPLTKLPQLADLPQLGYLGLCGLRDLDWPHAFDTLAALERIGTISFSNSTFATFDLRVLAIPGLRRLDVNKTRIDAAVWQECRERAAHVTIWGG